MKNNKAMVTISIILLILLIYWWFHPTYFLYNDRFIVGQHIDKIVSVYGEFDAQYFSGTDEGQVLRAAYLVKPRMQGFIDASWAVYYYIYFDDRGIATKVSLEEMREGG